MVRVKGVRDMSIMEKEYLKQLYEANKKIQKLVEALKFYASGQHIDSISIGSSYSIRIEDGTKAKDCLKEFKE